MVLTVTLATWASAQSSGQGEFAGPDQARAGGRVGLSVASTADHSGGDGPRASVMPAIEYQWANSWFAGTNRGVGYNFSKDPTLQYGLGLGVDIGRRESSTGALAGMGSVAPKLEMGVMFSPSEAPQIQRQGESVGLLLYFVKNILYGFLDWV